MTKKDIYLDHAASSSMHRSVLEHMISLHERHLGNPASIHRTGVMASLELEKARMTLAKKLGCSPEEIFFTSGATESNNLVLRGIAHQYLNSAKKEILISSIEHSSINQTAEGLKDLGFIVKKIPVDSFGVINYQELEKMISPATLLVSVIHANNEIGVVQNLEKISRLAKAHNVIFHSDGAQAFCKVGLDVKRAGVDLYSISSHKIHGPKGIGAIFVREGLALSPQMTGGGQESGVRSGTVAVELISSMARASELYNSDSLSVLKNLHDYLTKELKEKMPAVKILGHHEQRLFNIINLHIPGLSGKTCLHEMDQMGVRISVGSACHSGKKTPGHVLMAIGLNETEAFETIRISFGIDTSKEELDYFVECLQKVREQAIPSDGR